MNMTPVDVGATCILKRFSQDCYNFAVDLAFFLEKLFVDKVAKAVVAVAQLVESGIVIPVVVGSSPIGHPKKHRTPDDFRQVFLRLRSHFDVPEAAEAVLVRQIRQSLASVSQIVLPDYHRHWSNNSIGIRRRVTARFIT